MTQNNQTLTITAASAAEAIQQILAAARTYHAQGNLTVAESCYRKILELEPENPDGLHLLGVVAYQRGFFDASIDLMQRAARKAPADAAILVNMGAAYSAAGKPREAKDHYEAALRLQPDSLDARFNIIQALINLKDFDGAIEAGRKYITLNPTDAAAYISLGNALKYKGEPDAAMRAYEDALKLAPDNATAYANMSSIFLDRGHLAEAVAMMDKAIAIDPRPSDIRYRRGLKLLRQGDLARGWEDYESRFSAAKVRTPRHTTPAQWTGEDLRGKAILIWTEQGIGDEILYASMIPEVIAQAGRCIVECSPRMVPVFTRAFPEATVIPHTDGKPSPHLENLDYQCATTSLGRVLRTSFAAFRPHQGYLKADPARTAVLRRRYRDIAPGHLLVGLSWHSKLDVEMLKSLALVSWAEILKVPRVTFVNLQYGDHRAEIAAVREATGIEIVQDAEIDPLADMDAFFAQVAALDLVITTSNTTAHVAGSLHIPTWVMLSNGSPFYWFTERNDSPWYPSLELFRQSQGSGPPQETWQAVVARIAAALARRTATSG